MGRMKNDGTQAKVSDLEFRKDERSRLSTRCECERDSHDAAIDAAFGLFKGRDGFPQDGLKFQLEAGAEWPRDVSVNLRCRGSRAE
jgi:hypothetical protein